MCGKCRFCVAGRPVLCLEQGKALTTPLEGTPRAHDAKGAPLGIFSGCGAMAEYATVSAENLIKIDPKIPLDCAALVGCGVTTGVGAVFNTAKVEPGSSVAVFGCGGVGLSVIQGARHRRRAAHHRHRYPGAEARDGEEVRRHRYDRIQVRIPSKS